MAPNIPAIELPGTRGDPDHDVRRRILDATEIRFRHYGYTKTTVADIASDLGISTAYIYKFFASKLAICEAIVGEMVGRIAAGLDQVAQADKPASERLRLLYSTLLERSAALYLEERKMHDLVRAGLDARYQSVERLKDTMRQAARTIVEAGRASGEFETKTPLSDVVDAIWISLVPFAHPQVLEHLNDNIDLPRHARNIADLALRGMSRD
jgi:AcrR family transcriptional regulator